MKNLIIYHIEVKIMDFSRIKSKNAKYAIVKGKIDRSGTTYRSHVAHGGYSSIENCFHLSQRNDISTHLCVIAGKLESFYRYRGQDEAAVLALHARRFYEVLLYVGLDISSP